MSAFEHTSRAGLLASEVLGGTAPEERLRQLRAAPLRLVVSPALAETRRGQWMAATAANLLGRLFDFVGVLELDVPRAARVLPGVLGLRAGMRLDGALKALVESLGPPERRIRVSAAAPGEPASALVIGPIARALARSVLHVDGAGWHAGVGTEPTPVGAEPVGGFNPFGPLVAAAWGTAELMRSLLRSLDAQERLPVPIRSRVWNLWSHTFDGALGVPTLPERLELGDVGVAGLGALGSAAVLALAALENASGCLELVDDDVLAPTNLERVLLARAADLGRPKVELAQRALRCSGLRAAAIRGRYAATAPRRARARTLLVGVDSGAARLQLAGLEPLAIYNGGTQSSEFLVSRHVRGAGPCLACLYPQSEDRTGSLARRLGVDRATAAALAAGERRVDAEVLAALRRRGGVGFQGIEAGDLLDVPLATLENHVCSRAIVIEDLPEASIGFLAALCGFLMACELVKDRIGIPRDASLLDAQRPVFRLDVLAGSPGPECVEAYVPRRSCACRAAS